jgi:hypothetical protein
MTSTVTVAKSQLKPSRNWKRCTIRILRQTVCNREPCNATARNDEIIARLIADLPRINYFGSAPKV